MFKEIGLQLQKKREELGLSLDEIQMNTKIQKNFLLNIENGLFDKLPSPFYVRTYIRSYANYLKMEPQHILHKYRKAEQLERRNLNNNIYNPSTNTINNYLQNTLRKKIAAHTALTIAPNFLSAPTNLNCSVTSSVLSRTQTFISKPPKKNKLIKYICITIICCSIIALISIYFLDYLF